jgi:hypothetical protein
MSDTAYYGSLILLTLAAGMLLGLLLAEAPSPSEAPRCLCECVH